MRYVESVNNTDNFKCFGWTNLGTKSLHEFCQITNSHVPNKQPQRNVPRGPVILGLVNTGN